ncbi:MAG: aldehyde dehydrogenase family protein, partial [Candidatus Limiplasma sp.]|nr:aldehyde dehydrogenase family protein [Candidatus Limiplasma sp.]
MALTEQDIKKITDEIVRTLTAGLGAAAPAATAAPGGGTGRWLCDTAAEAVANAKAAQEQLADMTLEARGELIAAMRKAAIDNAEPLAKLAKEETGYGRVADKVQKNLLVARRTPGIEDLSTYCKTGDHGMMIVEQAPFGVIGSITPSTNPTSTVINNAISMISAGNAVVFNP